MVERGRQAIVLIPEIALTYQTLLRFYNRQVYGVDFRELSPCQALFQGEKLVFPGLGPVVGLQGGRGGA